MNSSNNIMVSVCMITYNHEQYIDKAIKGVLMQKCNFSVELIIGDDCSNDKTSHICLDYAEKYDFVRVITSESNIGMIPNFIRTISHCTGEYIAFCEGDDYWIDPYKLQKQVDYLDVNSNVSMVVTNYIVHDELSNRGKRKITTPSKIDYETLLKKKNIIATLTTCMRSKYVFEYLQEHEIYARTWPVGDYPLWLYLSLKGDIIAMNFFSSVYLKRQNSASHYSDKKKQFSFYLRVIEIANYYAVKFGASHSARKQIAKNKIITLINYGYSLKNTKMMRKWIIYYIYNHRRLPIKEIVKYILIL